MNEGLISVRNARFAYDGRTVLESVDFSVCRGDFICIVGPNGSGKSTLVRGLLGIKQPSGGEIERVSGLGIGYLPQRGTTDDGFPATVGEIVLSGVPSDGVFPFATRKMKETARDAMAKLGIDQLATRTFGELSGGQRQRVLLARAVCRGRDILLLDEPSTGLDPRIGAEVYEMVKELHERDGLTVVMVTHDHAAAARLCEKILHLDHEQRFFGAREEYFKSDVGRAMWERGDMTWS